MCTACNTSINTTEEFGGRLIEIMNGGALSMMISLGHRTGLFDAMGNMEWAGSPTIAAVAQLNERYVREWLGAMVAGRIVEYDPANGCYRLPQEHAAILTRYAKDGNFSVSFQFISVLGAVEDKILDCFKNGGGVPYSEFKRFHEVMAEESAQTAVAPLVEQILPLAPGLVERLKAGIDVLDVGCGSGRAINRMARAFPRSRFTGWDLSPHAVQVARNESAEHGLRNVRFEIRDLSAFHVDAPLETFDLVTAFDAIHDQARPDNVLAGIARSLRSQGIFLMQDIDASSAVHENIQRPLGPMFYTISTMHCMTVSLAQGGLGLGTAWGRQLATRMLDEAGFTGVQIHNLPHDIMNCYYIVSK